MAPNGVMLPDKYWNFFFLDDEASCRGGLVDYESHFLVAHGSVHDVEHRPAFGSYRVVHYVTVKAESLLLHRSAEPKRRCVYVLTGGAFTGDLLQRLHYCIWLVCRSHSPE